MNFTNRELNFILDSPTHLFGAPEVQRRNKAMCALLSAAKPSIDELRLFNVDDFFGDSIFMRRRAEGFNLIALSKRCRDIIADCVTHLHIDFPESRVLCHHPLLFNTKLPSHPMTEADILAIMKTCSPLALKRKKGEGHARTA